MIQATCSATLQREGYATILAHLAQRTRQQSGVDAWRLILGYSLTHVATHRVPSERRHSLRSREHLHTNQAEREYK